MVVDQSSLSYSSSEYSAPTSETAETARDTALSGVRRPRIRSAPRAELLERKSGGVSMVEGEVLLRILDGIKGSDVGDKLGDSRTAVNLVVNFRGGVVGRSDIEGSKGDETCFERTRFCSSHCRPHNSPSEMTAVN